MTTFKNPLTIVKQESGGSTSDDVRFIDYDGTIVAQMSIEEAQALTALPEGPEHQDLPIAFDSWTHTLQEVKSTDHILDVGAVYVSADNPEESIFGYNGIQAGFNPSFTFTQDTANGVTIDWGDGSAEETHPDVSSAITVSHTYTTSSAGMTFVRFTPANGVSLDFTSIGGANFALFGTATASGANVIPSSGLQSVIFTPGFASNTLPSFSQRNGAKCIIIPNTITEINLSTFSGNRALAKIVIPTSVTTIGNNAFAGTPALDRVVLPDGLTSVGTACFASASAVASGIRVAYIPSSLTSIPGTATASTGMFASAYCLEKILFGKNGTGLTIGGRFLNQTCSMRTLTIPSYVSSIGQNFFVGTGLNRIIFEDRSALPSFDSSTSGTSPCCVTLDFTNFTQVPVLTTDIMDGTYFSSQIVLVPTALEASWKAASGWSSHADLIIGV